jgi:hypothetical protein
MSTELFDPDPGSGEQPKQTRVRQGSPRQGLLIGLVAALIIVGAVLIASSDEPAADDPEPSTTTSAPSETSSAPPASTAPTGETRPAGPTTMDFEGVADPPGLEITLAVSGSGSGPDPGIQFWSLDLAAGMAELIPLGPEAAQLSIADVRFFGSDRAVAVLEDGNFATLDVGQDSIALDRVVDIGTRVSFGVDAFTPDGRFAWVGIPTGLIRWRLEDDQVDERWIDNFGDRTALPSVKGIVDSGLVVEGSGRTFLISAGEALGLELNGEVVSSGADWLVLRSCDDTLRCGQLTFQELGTAASLTLEPLYRFRLACGLVTAAADGTTLRVLAQKLGSLMLLSIADDGTFTESALHPAGIGCVDAADSDEGVLVVAHDRGLSLVGTGGEQEAAVTLIRLERLRPIVAVGVSPGPADSGESARPSPSVSP